METWRVEESLVQESYFGRGSWLHINLYAGVSEKVGKGIIAVLAEADKALYFGVHQHLGTQAARGVSGINGAPLKTDAVEGGLYDDVLLSVNTPAYFVPFSGGDIHLIPQTAKLKAVLKPGRSAIIACGEYVFVLHRNGTDMVPTAG